MLDREVQRFDRRTEKDVVLLLGGIQEGSVQDIAASWCKGWRGMTSVPESATEQLCQCSATNTTSDADVGFCQVQSQ